jgi:hypothetical protein
MRVTSAGESKMGELGGFWWVLIDVIGVAILGGALFYGMGMWRKRRTRSADAVRDAATDRLYGKQ